MPGATKPPQAASAPEASPYLCTHAELPAWAHDNEFIVRGYRRPGGTAADRRARGAQGVINGDAAAASAKASGSARNGAANGTVRRARAQAPKAGSEDTQDETAPLEDETASFEHDTFGKCWASVWRYWHNETVNIHTHLWGALLALLLGALHLLYHTGALPPPLARALEPLAHHPVFYPRAFPALEERAHTTPSTRADSAPLHAVLAYALPSDARAIAGAWSRPAGSHDVLGFAAFFLGAAVCLSFSASFHTLQAHSRGVAKKCNQLDYVGIVAMICGSFVPALHYGFHCHARWALAYTAANLALGAVATVLVVAPHYATPAYRPVRTGIFLTHGLSALVPTAHVLWLYGHAAVARMMGVNFLAASGALYVAGALLYVARVPERFAPGRFDYVGASHQIFHTFILLAAAAHYVSIRRGHAFWHAVEAVGGDRSAAAVCAALEQWRA